MNYLIDKITVIIVLFEEEINLIFRCLENIKNYKIIIVDNAGNFYLKKKIEEKFKIYLYILNFSSIFFLRETLFALSTIIILKFFIFSKHLNTRFVFSLYNTIVMVISLVELFIFILDLKVQKCF